LKGQTRIDEFAFILLAGVVLMIILLLAWGAPPTPIISVEPTSIAASIANGTSKIFYINITGTATNVFLSGRGAIANWISFDKNNFNLTGTVTVRTIITAPSSANGTYSGSIVINYNGENLTIPVTINVATAQLLLNSRAINLGNFSISYTNLSRVLDSRDNVEISRSYLSEWYLTLTGQIDESKLPLVKNGKISLVIDATNSYGPLMVFVNDVEVFNKKVGPGFVEIPISPQLIKSSNIVKVVAGTPGLRFWASTVYRIRSINFSVSFEGAVAKEISFSLNKSEIDNFDHFQLLFRLVNCMLPPSELFIEINDQIVFAQRPPLTFFNETFRKDVLGNKLYLGENNTIRFSFEKEGYCEMANALLIVFYSS